MRWLHLILGVGWLLGSMESQAEIRAGAARRDVTPKEPVPMWGYGARKAVLSNGTMDPLYAAILVLEVGGQKMAIVGTDLGRSPSESSLSRIRKAIQDRCGISVSFISGSHSHHGPVLELVDEPGRGQGKFDAAIRYVREMEESIISGIEEADSKLVPAKLAAGSVILDSYNRNRHTKLEPKPVDRELAVLRVDDQAGKPLAIVVNFAAHPTTIPAQVLQFSADYVGAMRQAVEAETGATAIFMQGASGDLSVNQGTNQGYKAYGQALGKEVLKLSSSLRTESPATAELKYEEERFDFVPRINLGNPLVRALYDNAFFPELVANFVAEYEEGIRPRLTVALLNSEIALVGVSGEFFANHSIRLKERARVKQVFFFGYCNGYHQYFPTIEAVAEGGYGADTTVAPAPVGAGEEIMNTALVRIYQLLGKIKGAE